MGNIFERVRFMNDASHTCIQTASFAESNESYEYKYLALNSNQKPFYFKEIFKTFKLWRWNNLINLKSDKSRLFGSIVTVEARNSTDSHQDQTTLNLYCVFLTPG